MKRAAESNGFTWSDPSVEWKRGLLDELTEIAASHRIRLTVCSQPEFIVPGSGEARCVDALRLSEIGGTAFKIKLKGNRKECGCYEARDIGEYDTCPHGCVYCYAVQNRPLALDRFRQHNPESEFLFPPPTDATEAVPRRKSLQLRLFDEPTSSAE